METKPHTSSAERSFAIPMLVLVLLVVSALAGCSGMPRLTAEDRRSDIEFLARWAKDYHVCVEVNSTVGGMPDYQNLLPKYMDLDINPDGTFNELTGVQPDVELPSCPLPHGVDREILLKDPWIQAVINGLSAASHLPEVF